MEHPVSTEDWKNSTSKSENPYLENCGARKPFCKTSERNGAESTCCPSCMNGSTCALSAVCNMLKESMSTFRSFQQSSDKGLAELKSFASAMIQEEKQTNRLLEALLREVTKQAGSTGGSSWPSCDLTSSPPTMILSSSSTPRSSARSSPPWISASSSSLKTPVCCQPLWTFASSSSHQASSSSPCLKISARLSTCTCSQPLRSSVSCGCLVSAEAASLDPSPLSAGHEPGKEDSVQRLLETQRQEENIEGLYPPVSEDNCQDLSLTGVHDCGLGEASLTGTETMMRRQDHKSGLSDPEFSLAATETNKQGLSDMEREESEQMLSDSGKEESDKGLSDTAREGSDNGLSGAGTEESDTGLSDTGKEESDKGLSDTGREESYKGLSDTGKDKEENDNGVSDTGKEESDKGLSDTGREENDKELSDTQKEKSDKGLSDTGKEESDKGLSDTGREENDKELSDTQKEKSDKGLSDTGREESDKVLSDTGKKESDKGLSATGKEKSDKGLSDTGREESDKELSDIGKEENDKKLPLAARADTGKNLSNIEVNESGNTLTEAKRRESDREFPGAETVEYEQELSDTSRQGIDHILSQTVRAESDQRLSDTGRMESDVRLCDTGRRESDGGLSDTHRVGSNQRLSDTCRVESNQSLSDTGRVENDRGLSQRGRGRNDERLAFPGRRDNDEEPSQTERRENRNVGSPCAIPISPQTIAGDITFSKTVPESQARALPENTGTSSSRHRSPAERSQSVHNRRIQLNSSHKCHITKQTETFDNSHFSNQTERSPLWSERSRAETQVKSTAGRLGETEQPVYSSTGTEQSSPTDHYNGGQGPNHRTPTRLQSLPAPPSQGPSDAEQNSARRDGRDWQKGGTSSIAQRLKSKTQTQKDVQRMAPRTSCNVASSPAVPGQSQTAPPTNLIPATRHIDECHSSSSSERIAEQIQKDRELAIALTERRRRGGSHRMQDALSRAQAPDLDPPPKAQSYDTILCLDVSESMNEEGAFTQMMAIVNDFINGIEENAVDFEENIGVVTFGTQTNVIQHLTNDFERVRNAIGRIEVGGKSPFYEAMAVCLVAFDGKGGTVSVSGEYDVHPRIIFITDGLITESSDDPFGMDRVMDASNTRAKFSTLMMSLSPKKHPSVPHPIVFIPVGCQADQSFLQSCATLCDGQLVEPRNLISLCNYFRVQEAIGQVIVCLLANKDKDLTDDHIQALVLGLGSHHGEEDMAEIIQTVKQEMAQQPRREDQHTTDPTNLDEVFENEGGVAKSELLPLGTRVLRGPDWMWGNQDHSGPGTVIQHEDKKHPFTWVLWDFDGQWNRYPYGALMGSHLLPTDKHPVFLSEDRELRIGMTVVKGAEWNTSDSPYDTMPGVIIRKSRDGLRLKVRWQNGDMMTCSVHAVEFRDPFSCEFSTGRKEIEGGKSLGEELFGHSVDYDGEFNDDGTEKVAVWQRRGDDGCWHVYTEEENSSLEKAYLKKYGSCLIQRQGNIYRVNFRKMLERHVDKKKEREVQRVLLPTEDYECLLQAEELS